MVAARVGHVGTARDAEAGQNEVADLGAGRSELVRGVGHVEVVRPRKVGREGETNQAQLTARGVRQMTETAAAQLASGANAAIVHIWSITQSSTGADELVMAASAIDPGLKLYAALDTSNRRLSGATRAARIAVDRTAYATASLADAPSAGDPAEAQRTLRSLQFLKTVAQPFLPIGFVSLEDH